MSRAIRDRLIAWFHEPDKLQHIIISLALVQGMLPWTTIWLSVLVTFLIGMAKETWDALYGAGFSWGDIVANCLGIGLGVILLWPYL